MKNLLIFLTISLGFFNSALSQTKYNWRNTNEHYQGLYILNRDVLLNEDELPQNNIGLAILLENNIYVIKLKIFEKLSDSIIWYEYKYDGKYSVNEKGYVILHDQHPFNSNELFIKETIDKFGTGRRVESRDIAVKLSNENKKFTNNKLILQCYGCLLQPEEENYRILNYFPSFYPSYRNVKHESLISVKKSLNELLDTSSFELKFTSSRKYHISDTIHISVFVDSMKFDTVYVSKGIYRFNGFSESLSGKGKHPENGVSGYFNLNQVLKLNINIFLYSMEEHSELYVEPSLSSKSVYSREEIDRLQNLRLISFSKDKHGINWVKIEFDLFENFNRSSSIHHTGWVMQNSILLY